MNFERTGGWQNWETQSTLVDLPEGKYILRLLVSGQEHNLNWFRFAEPVALEETAPIPEVQIYPNPSKGIFTVRLTDSESGITPVIVLDALGKTVFKGQVRGGELQVDGSGFSPGIYFLRVGKIDAMVVRKLLIKP
jgi:hypothetical protein